MIITKLFSANYDKDCEHDYELLLLDITIIINTVITTTITTTSTATGE